MNYTARSSVSVPPAPPVNIQHGQTVNRFEMFNAMVSRTLISVGGYRCLIIGIDMEDGSGHCFNVRVSIRGQQYTIFVRG